MFTRARHWALFWAISIQSTSSHPMSVRPIITFSSHAHLDLASGPVRQKWPSLFSPNVANTNECFCWCRHLDTTGPVHTAAASAAGWPAISPSPAVCQLDPIPSAPHSNRWGQNSVLREKQVYVSSRDCRTKS
jgi:hypothetical protein